MAGVTDFIALDVETANADFGSICSIGLVHFRAGQVFKSLTILVDPEDDFDPINIGIHGIRPEDVAGKPTMAQVFPAISEQLRDVVVVHHSPFDRSAMVRAAAKYGSVGLSCIWLDTIRVARRAWPALSETCGYGLAALTEKYGIEFQHHDAAEDARATGLILLRAMCETSLDIEGWLIRVEQTISGRPQGKFAQSGSPTGLFYGETVVFTGKLELSRAAAADLAARAGCNVEDSVTKRTTMLVVGDQDLRRTNDQDRSSKHKKAEKLIGDGVPIRIVGETDFLGMVS